MYNRIEFKKQAKQLMKGSAPHFMLVALVYYLLTSALRLVVSQVTSMVGLDAGVPAFFLSILIMLFGYVMTIGFSNYVLRLSRRQETGIRSLFDSFSYAGRSIGVTLLTALYTFAWTMLLMFGFAIVVAVVTLVFSAEELMAVAVILTVVLYLVLLVLIVLISMRYTMAPFALVEAPELGVSAAVRRSVQIMRKNKGKLFMLLLSFIGWELLVALLATAVIAVGFVVSDTSWVAGAFTAALEDAEQMTMVFEALAGQMNLWILLSEVVCIPLNLWLLTYMYTALARFYNYVSGYDYIMANKNDVQEETQTPAAVGAAADETIVPEMPQPPAGGYYTPPAVPQEEEPATQETEEVEEL